MSPKLMFVWRHSAQVIGGLVVSWLLSHGLDVDRLLHAAGLDQSAADLLATALFAAGVAAYGWLQHWLETRPDTGPWRYLRAVGRILVVGAPVLPVYAKPRDAAAVQKVANASRW